MFEELFRTLAPQAQSLAFTPEQMAEFRRRAAELPTAPSGDFFQVPSGSQDPQAGQLLPLTGGQPTPIMAKGLNFPSVRGAQQADLPRAPIDVAPLNVQMPPPNTSPRDVFAPPASAPKGDPFAPTEADWNTARGGMTTEQSRENFLRQNPAIGDLFQAERSAAAAPTNPTDDAWQRAWVASGRGPMTPMSLMAMRSYLESDQQRASDANRASMQQAELQNRLGVAGIEAASRSNAARGDVFNTAKLKALEGIRTGQITPEQLGSTMNLLSGDALRSPDAMQAAIKDATAQASQTAEINSLRSLLGPVDANGRPAGAPTGSALTAMIDRMKPEMAPQVASAIRSGQFGDPIAVRNAAFNSLAQNYLMSQGRLPGGEGNIPGRYTIPFGDKPLVDMIATPPTNTLDTLRRRASSAQSGVPYDTLRLPDGTQIPFDASGVQGLSNMAATLGYNQQKAPAAARLPRLALLAQLLGQQQ